MATIVTNTASAGIEMTRFRATQRWALPPLRPPSAIPRESQTLEIPRRTARVCRVDSRGQGAAPSGRSPDLEQSFKTREKGKFLLFNVQGDCLGEDINVALILKEIGERVTRPVLGSAVTEARREMGWAMGGVYPE